MTVVYNNIAIYSNIKTENSKVLSRHLKAATEEVSVLKEQMEGWKNLACLGREKRVHGGCRKEKIFEITLST